MYRYMTGDCREKGRHPVPDRTLILYLALIGFFAIFSTTISKNPVLPLFAQGKIFEVQGCKGIRPTKTARNKNILPLKQSTFSRNGPKILGNPHVMDEEYSSAYMLSHHIA